MKNSLTLLLSTLCVILTLNSGAIAQQRSLKQETIFRVQMGNVEDIELLVTKLGNPNATDDMGWPLLSIAAGRTDSAALEVVKALVELGADINYPGANNHYPLITAVQNGNVEIVQYLLDNGANYRISDALGFKVVDFARQSGNDEIIRIIESRMDNDMMDLARMRTQEALDELSYDVAYHGCAFQYFSFYYKSKQDPIPEATQKATLDLHKKKLSDAMSKLYSFFRVPTDISVEIFNEAKSAMHKEMESMISNRWRRSKGVGQPGDMEKRCKAIAAPYADGYYDRNELQQLYKR